MFLVNLTKSVYKMNKYQKEYICRINKVLDYVENHLDEELNLQQLADVANFSAFHFHRIFAAFTGETLNSYVKRKRVEKAGSLLLKNPDETVSEIAWQSGFNNTSVFCRNFKERFKMSAREFRETRLNENSKNGQLKSKNGKPAASGLDYVCRVQKIKNGGFMNSKIAIKDMPELKLVYCTHKGPFYLIGQAYGKLMKWAGPRGLLTTPNLKTVTVYHDDPTVTEMDKVRQSACITVDREIKPEGEFGNLSVPAGKYVVGSFEISDKEFEQAWNSVCLWLSESGYQPSDGLPYELYHNDHEQHPQRKFIVDICVPVKPM